MSSRKRRQQFEENDFLSSNVSKPLDPKSADAALYGFGDLAKDIAAADTQYQAIEAVDIFSILPNQIQPRYTIPHDLTEIYQFTPDNIPDIFGRWIADVELERKSDFNILNFLLGSDTVRGSQVEKDETELTALSTKPSHPKEKSLMKIIDLAASIRRDGLSNPISLVRQDNHFEIETGERRWLAYHLLYWKFGDNDLVDEKHPRNWSMIPSRMVPAVDVWRQASENNARDNLNAIGKARQLALLLMDLIGWENFAPFSNFPIEQEFYSQVGDGNQWRIPYGSGEQLLNAMGLSDASQIRQYRALLRLPNDVWRIGDDNNLTEGELRKYVAGDKSVTRVTVSGKSANTVLDKLANDANQWRKKIKSQMKSKDRAERENLKQLLAQEIDNLQSLMSELDNLD